MTTDPTATPDLQARYDIQTRELQRERAEHRQTLAQVTALRLALGLHPTGAPSPTRPRTQDAADGR
jgi:hypothetical protein